MKWAPYPKYKKSDAEWLGDVPEHWDVKRLKTSATYIVSNVDKIKNEEEVPIRLCNYTDVYYNEHIYPDMQLMEATATPQEIYRFGLKVDDIIITKDSEDWRDIAVPALVTATAPDLVCGYHLAMIRPNAQKLKGRFLFRSFQSKLINQQFQISASGVTRYGLPKSSIGEAFLPVPPVEEQIIITDFLDRVIDRIDKLIEKKRAIIELLKEKRTALISQTVTRGLPADIAREFDLEPHTRFMDSGLEWLGEVPEKWGKARKLTHFALGKKNSFVNGPFGSDLLSSEIVGEGVPVIYIRDISSGKYRRKSEGHVTKEKAEQLNFCSVIPGDILIAKVGDPPGTAVVYPKNEPQAIVTQDVIRLRVDLNKVTPRYLAYFLNSSSGKGLIDQVAIESTRMRVGLGDYKGSLAIFPPINEQTAIATFLDRETDKLDRLVEKVEKAIECLQEYRTALITAAVTGKIDVRNQAQKEEAA